MDLEVRHSDIHSRGVFALRDFLPGEIVLKWDVSKCLSKPEVDKIPEEEKEFLHPIKTDSFILVQPPERFVNHSCDHNTEVRKYCDIAIREIHAGEEITSNYETDGAGLSFTCHCRSLKCRVAIGVR